MVCGIGIDVSALQRCAAADKLEALAVQARRLVKNARKLVSRGTLPKRLQSPFVDAFAPRRAMDFADAIRNEVRCVRPVRELVVQLDIEARAIADLFELPYAKEEVQSCKCSMDRMQLRSERVYKVARPIRVYEPKKRSLGALLGVDDARR